MVGQTALHAAIDRKQSAMVPFLVKKGLSVDSMDTREQTPLAQACANGDLSVVNQANHNDWILIFCHFKGAISHFQKCQDEHRKFVWPVPSRRCMQQGT